MTLFVIGCSLGGLFGGKIGDILAKRFPNSGRIVLSQISSGSAIPIAAILLLALPDDPSSAFVHGLVFFIMGFFIYWNGPATNMYVFLIHFVVPSVLGLLGILAQHVYGYKPIPEGASDSVEIETDRENAASLAKALYTAVGIPMTICCFIYSFLYCAYPGDRERAQTDALIESGNATLGSRLFSINSTSCFRTENNE
ncbi:hypothetical protein Patl1_27259 [Pistacia atlantica]|uniref:Uncharacterized protein n=1 Tax=Pistacia atlantica TaxID=434234 RepID=A0ACC1BBU3_9ROSI|nr:hypothetical protein Patl1_27259 [Pistacia atlantica]